MFIEYSGNNIGKSIKEKNCDSIIEEIISLSKKKIVKLFIQKMLLYLKI